MSILSFDFGSLFSSFLTSGNPADAVQNAELQLEAAVGNFLITGQIVAGLKTQAEAQRNSPNSVVVQKAVALSGNASALLSEYGSIQNAAQTLINQIIDLKKKINSDPAKYADPSSSTYFGWSVMDVLSQNKQAIIQATSDSAAMIRRINTYETNVDRLKSDVAGLIDFAQGKGVTAALSAWGSSTESIAKVGVTVGVGALAVYFLAPSFIPRMLGSLGGRKRARR